MDQVNINQSPQTQGINIDAGLTAPMLTPDTAETRAVKARYGMLGLMPEKTQDDWYSDIISGQEDTARKEAASKVDMYHLNRRLQSILGGGGIIPAAEAPTPPDSVFEEQFTNRYLTPLVDRQDKNTARSDMPHALDNIPDIVRNAINRGQDWGARGQLIDTELENNKDAANSYGAKFSTLALGAIPGASSLAMRLPALHYQGIRAAFGTLGPDFESQAQSLWALPTFEEFKDRLKEIKTQLGPTLYFQWLSQIKDQSYDEKLSNSAFDAMDLSVVGSPALKALANRTVSAVKTTVTAMNQARKMAPEVAAAAARGDLSTAATEQMSQTLEDANKKPAPIAEKDRAINSLLSMSRVDEENLRKGPSAYGQDIMNRISQRVGNFVDYMSNKIQSVMRVNRTPYVLAKRDVIEAEKERIKGEFRGPSNAIIDIDGPFYEDVSPGGAGKLTNTHWFEVKMGDFNGRYWGSEDQARLFAEFIGLQANRKPYGHEPLLGMNKSPIEYDNYSQFRDAARRAGLKPKDLKESGIDSSVKWQGAKDSQVPLKGYDIKNQGNGWYISIPKTFKETTEHVIDALATDVNTKSPFIWSNQAFGWSVLRQPPDTLSRAGMAERRVAAHGPSELKKLIAPINYIMSKVPREYRGRFNEMIKFGHELYDKNGNKGYFFEHPQDLEDWHQLMYNGELPPAAFTEAYFSGWVPMANFDLAMRNILVYRNQAISGAEFHRIWRMTSKGEKKFSDEFSAIPHGTTETFPNGEDTLLFAGPHGEWVGKANSFAASKLGKETMEQWQKGEISVFRIYDPRQRPLTGWSNKINDQRVRYVITKNVVKRPLDVGEMVPRRGGGHVAYTEYDDWLKQADMRYDEASDTWWNEGDKTIMPVRSPGEAKLFEKKLDTIRLYMQAGMIDEAKTLMKELPIPVDDHLGWYQARINQAGKRLPPFLNVNSPIRHVKNHESIAGRTDELSKLFGDKYRDGTKTGGDAAKFEVEFTGERDADQLFTLTAKGTKANPLYEYHPVNIVDSIPTAWRAMNSVIKSFYNDDLKLQAMKTWLKEAQPLLNKNQNDIWHAPWWNFNNPVWRPDADPRLKGFLEANRYKIQQFSGIRNPLQTWLHTVTSKLSENLFNMPGGRIVPLHRIPLIKDPLRIIRSLVVHRSLGLFNVPSMFVQGSTTGNILAFAGPRHALPGIGAAILDRWTRWNQHPEFIKTLDKILSTMGPDIDGGFWRPGEFIEANQKKIASGFNDVDREHIYSIDPDTARYVPSKFGKFLHWGMWPFREGAEFVRAASYYTAYHEFRHGGGYSKAGRQPFTMGEKQWGDTGISGAMTREHEAEILNRAGWLDHNMTRAAASTVQQGAASIPMLFISYRLRLTEALFSRELNPMEKARLLGFSMFLYGLPAGPLGLVGLPVGDWLRQYAIDNGYNVGQNFGSDAMMQGVVGTALAFITGAAGSNLYGKGTLAWKKGEDVHQWYGRVKDTLAKIYAQGNQYNVGDRFGNEGLASALTRSDAIIQGVGGAPYGTLQDAYWRLGPLVSSIMHPYQHPPKASDILDAGDVLNGYANIHRTITAFTTHQQISKSGLKLSPTEISQANALFQGTTGLSDARTAKAFVLNRMTDHLVANQQEGQRIANTELRKYFTATKSDPKDGSANDYIIRAHWQFIIAGNPEHKWAEFMAKAADNFDKNIVDTTMERWWKTQGDEDKAARVFQEYQQQLTREHERGER